MVNKVEAYGIALSIGAMVLALWLVRVETTNNAFLTAGEGATETSAVYVAGDEDQRAAVANAILDASNDTGAISRLIVDDIIIGDGSVVEKGDTVTAHYIGTLQNGQQFDNSYLKGEPFTFEVGKGRVIKGWDEGIIGMREGGQRILVIPSDLAYGSDGFGPIPGDATLVFAIELLSIDE